MKITKRQLRRIIKEGMASDRIYLDNDTSDQFDLDYDNTGHEWTIYPEDFQRLKRMTQYDTAHQKIFSKYELINSTTAVGAGYGWWTLGE
jgi:hypothetical protein|tara:strand:+ start:1859 stop:2128 length:270 start_codon:yes stop_codon:yes gene_type:complete